jgi:putative ABC transport system ATP-binding protein
MICAGYSKSERTACASEVLGTSQSGDRMDQPNQLSGGSASVWPLPEPLVNKKTVYHSC